MNEPSKWRSARRPFWIILLLLIPMPIAPWYVTVSLALMLGVVAGSLVRSETLERQRDKPT